MSAIGISIAQNNSYLGISKYQELFIITKSSRTVTISVFYNLGVVR
jgi:hypothetical protein